MNKTYVHSNTLNRLFFQLLGILLMGRLAHRSLVINFAFNLSDKLIFIWANPTPSQFLSISSGLQSWISVAFTVKPEQEHLLLNVHHSKG